MATIDIAELVKGLLADLSGLREEGTPPNGEPSVLRQLDGILMGLRRQTDEQLQKFAGAYRERTEAAQRLLADRRKRLEAYAGRERRVVVPEKDKFIVAGRITDGTSGVALPNVAVRAFDAAGRNERASRRSHTDTLGYFRVEYTKEELRGFGDGRLEIDVEVLDESGATLATARRCLEPKAGGTEFVDLHIDGDRVPASKELGHRIEGSVARRLAQLGRRVRVAAPSSELWVRRFASAPAPRRGGATALPAASGAEATRYGGRASPREQAPRPKPASGEIPVLEVRGIGPRFAARLREHGLESADQIASTDADWLAEILGIGRSRSENIIGDARRLLGRS